MTCRRVDDKTPQETPCTHPQRQSAVVVRVPETSSALTDGSDIVKDSPEHVPHTALQVMVACH